MATAASSFLAYSSIGFEKTRTEAFDDLKAEQLTLSTKVDEIVQQYDDLKDRIEDDKTVNTSSVLQTFTAS